MTKRQHFGWFDGQGFGVQGWGTPGVEWGFEWQRPDIWVDAVRTFERAGFDFFLLKDGTIVQGWDELPGVSLASAEGGPRHEPILLVPYLLQATSSIGIIPTLNSSHYDPYYAARQIATLYHFDSPRVGLNVVTGLEKEALRNMSTARPPADHESAYRRAHEWVDVVKGLWRSWEPEALVRDNDAFRYAEASRVHRIDHRGEFFDVSGPGVSLPFADQGPVLTSPGSSPTGLAYAGAHSDVQFTFATSADAVRRNVDALRGAALARGRAADAVKVFSVISPRIVGSDAERAAEQERLGSDAELRRLLSIQAVILKIDFTALDLGKPIPRDFVTDPGVLAFLRKTLFAGTEDPFSVPLRDLARSTVHGGPGSLIGTVEQIADHIESFGAASGHSGFLFNFNVDPTSVFRVLGDLVPELRRRGILRREHSGDSLRDNLCDF